MTRSSTFILLSAAILFAPSSLQADDPINKNLAFSIHEDPNDPETPVVFVVELDLRAADADGDDVGWEVKQARFKKLDGQNRFPSKRSNRRWTSSKSRTAPRARPSTGR